MCDVTNSLYFAKSNITEFKYKSITYYYYLFFALVMSSDF